MPPIAARRALKRLLAPLPPWIRTGPTNKPRVAITIDDMWGTFGADNANAAMDVAKAKGVKLSFFPTGGALEEHIALGRQAVWQRAIAEGHDIGNHTYTHTNLTKLNDDQIRGELNHTKDLLAQCLGPVPYTMRLMRPPGGGGGFVSGGDPRIMNVVTGFGYSMTMWTVDANGAKGNTAVANKLLSNASNGTHRAHPLHRVHARRVADVDRPPAQRQEARTDQRDRSVHLSCVERGDHRVGLLAQLFEGGVVLRVERGALIDRGVVVGERAGETGLHRGAHGLEVALVEIGEAVHTLVEGGELVAHGGDRLLHLRSGPGLPSTSWPGWSRAARAPWSSRRARPGAA